MRQSKINRRSKSIYGQNVSSRKDVFVWCIKNDEAEKVRGRPRASYTRLKIVSLSKVENFLSGNVFADQNALQQAVVPLVRQTSYPLERNATVGKCLNLKKTTE
jgi:hypothetical protein